MLLLVVLGLLVREVERCETNFATLVAKTMAKKKKKAAKKKKR